MICPIGKVYSPKNRGCKNCNGASLCSYDMQFAWSRKLNPKKIEAIMKKKTTIEVSRVEPAANVKVKGQPKRGSKYDKIYKQLADLKRGQAFFIDIPKGVSSLTIINRLNQALNRAKIEPPKGCKFTKHTTVNNRIAVVCEAK